MPHPTATLDLRLASLERKQLEALVRRLLSRSPELIHLVHLPLPGEVAREESGRIAELVTHILRTMGDDWQASQCAEVGLWPLVQLGEQYRVSGWLADARIVFATVATTLLQHYEQILDAQREVAGIVDQCVEGLGRCLAATTNPAGREVLLRDVFAVYRWDALEHDGYGLADAPRRVLLGDTTANERAMVAAWLQSAIPRTASPKDRRRRQRAGRLMLDLLGDALNAADRERLYADTDLDRLRLDLLLEQGRVEEAVQLVRATSSEDLLALANRLVACGLGEAARSAVGDHRAVFDPDNPRARAWLAGQGVTLPPNFGHLVAAVRWFQVRTNVGNYQALRREAEVAGRWPAVLAAVGVLDPHKKTLQPVRARLRADLGDAAGALAELEGLTGSTWKSAAADVASGLEATHPRVAADLLRRLVDVLLAHGTKAAGAQAGELRRRLDALDGRPG